jgi:hypothetical protein
MNSYRKSYFNHFQKIESLAVMFPYISVPSKSIDKAIYSKSYRNQITERTEEHLAERRAHTTSRRFQLLVGQFTPKYRDSVWLYQCTYLRAILPTYPSSFTPVDLFNRQSIYFLSVNPLIQQPIYACIHPGPLLEGDSGFEADP